MFTSSRLICFARQFGWRADIHPEREIVLVNSLLFSILILPLLGLGIALLVAIARSILGPINRAAGHLNARVRFRLSDFFWLVVQLQVVLGLLLQSIGFDDTYGDARAGFLFLLVLLLGATVALWAGAVSCVAKAGVNDAHRRGFFIVVLLPATLAVMILLPVALTFAVGLIFASVSEPQLAGQQIPQILGLLAAVVLLAAIGWCLRWSTKWVLVGNRSANENSETERGSGEGQNHV